MIHNRTRPIGCYSAPTSCANKNICRNLYFKNAQRTGLITDKIGLNSFNVNISSCFHSLSQL
jgi:hypothetical protein